MELDKKKIQNLMCDLWHLWIDCRFVGYDLTKDKYREEGRVTLHDIVGSGNFKALRTNTDELEYTSYGIANALHCIERLRMHYKKVSDGLDYFEGVLKKIEK
jgi:hypothetical protein